MIYEGDGDINGNWRTWNGYPGIWKETGKTGDQRKNRDILDHSIVAIVLNTEKSPEDLKRLAVT